MALSLGHAITRARQVGGDAEVRAILRFDHNNTHMELFLVRAKYCWGAYSRR